jgi:AcrR family transcriptional regulator
MDLMEQRRRGRPLDRSRDRVILETTLRLLSDVGYDRFRMQDVSTHAEVGLSTIYRRWPTKNDLILAAIQSATAEVAEPATAGLDGYRRHLKDLAVILHTEQADLIPGIIAALHRDPDLSDAFRTTWMTPRLTAFRAAIDTAATKPIDGNTAHLIAEVGLGVLILRTLVTHEAVTDSIIDQIVDQVIAPLLDVPAPSRRRRQSSPKQTPRAASGHQSNKG